MVTIPKSHMNIPRSNMPQVKKEHHETYFKWLESHGVAVKRTTTTARKLKASQNEFNIEKVKAMMQKVTKDNDFCMVSNDNFILDGHHRWLANYNKNPNHPVHIVKIDPPIHDLLVMTKKFDKVMYRDVHEVKSFKDFLEIAEDAESDIRAASFAEKIQQDIVSAFRAAILDSKDMLNMVEYSHKTDNGNEIEIVNFGPMTGGYQKMKGPKHYKFTYYGYKVHTEHGTVKLKVITDDDYAAKALQNQAAMNPTMYDSYEFEFNIYALKNGKFDQATFMKSLASNRVRALMSHEFTHYQDFKRAKINPMDFARNYVSPSKGFDAYIQQDVEVNARYSAMVELIKSSIPNDIASVQQGGYKYPVGFSDASGKLTNFKTFMVLMKGLQDDSQQTLYFDRMKPEQKIKLTRRLYKLWDYLKDKNLEHIKDLDVETIAVTPKMSHLGNVAATMGLDYVGFGRWTDKKHKVKYIKKGDKLIPFRLRTNS